MRAYLFPLDRQTYSAFGSTGCTRVSARYVTKISKKNNILGDFFIAHQKELTHQFCLVCWRPHFYIFLVPLLDGIEIDFEVAHLQN
jgi:hypothetical protein